MKKTLFLLLVLPFFAFGQNGINQVFNNMERNLQFTRITPFRVNKTTKMSNNIFKEGFVPILLDIDTKAINQVNASTHLLEITLPTNDKKNLELELYAVDFFSPDFKVLNSKGEEVSYTKGLYFHGRIKGDTNSIAAISITNDEISGMISDKTGDRTLKKNKTTNVYSVYYEKGLNNFTPFQCGIVDDDATPLLSKPTPIINGVVSCKVVNIYIVADYELYIANNSSFQNTGNYVNSIFNQVAVLYKNENIAIQISSILIWNRVDPYSGTNSSDVLRRFTCELGGQFTGNLAHLFSGKDIGGGAAWIDVLCNQYSFPDCNKIKAHGVSCMPFGGTYDGEYTTSPVGEIAHELGHNIGSRHTQWCNWNGGPIDNCYFTENNNGVCINGNTVIDCPECSRGPSPTNGGTIMSYCHLDSGVGINLSNGFGPQPGVLIRNRVGQCGLTDNNVPSNPANQNISESVTQVSWTLAITSTNFTVRYRKAGESTWQTTNTSSNVVVLSNLCSGTQYEWQVTGDCSQGNYTALITFTTSGIVKNASIQVGNWNEAATWQCGSLPSLTKDVELNHNVTIDGITAEANKIIYNGGTIKFINNGKLRVNQ